MARPRTTTTKKPAVPEREPGSKPLTFRGETAWYTPEEQELMRSLPNDEEGERCATLIHDAKVHLDATLVPLS